MSDFQCKSYLLLGLLAAVDAKLLESETRLLCALKDVQNRIFDVLKKHCNFSTSLHGNHVSIEDSEIKNLSTALEDSHTSERLIQISDKNVRFLFSLR